MEMVVKYLNSTFLFFLSILTTSVFTFAVMPFAFQKNSGSRTMPVGVQSNFFHASNLYKI